MLTLEWVALVTVLCIGIIGGLGLVRIKLVSEFVQLTEVICDTNIGP